ncbi:hypothetical protein [Streptomyces sp. NPDC056401]|uniref:hypothetical protein n=1 Tax=Streptomyces sp. NPDC056401 TaxID=3345809 RepID=UPI0035E195D2
MAGIHIEVEIQGDKEIGRKLRAMGVAALNLTAGMKDVGSYLTGLFSGEVFASRGGIIDKAWAPLSDRYAAHKAKLYPGRPPLIRTGVMNRSYQFDATRSEVQISNPTKQFVFTQLGTRRMPARPTMGLVQPQERRVVEILSRDITEQIRRA